jgi:hypothetical protein
MKYETREQFEEAARERGITDPKKISRAAFDYQKKFGEFKARGPNRPTGTTADPFTSVNQLLGMRYPENPEASRLFQNPEEQAAAVAKAQQGAVSSLPIRDRMLSGSGRFAYGFVPGEKARAERQVFDMASAGDLPTKIGRLAPEIAMSMAGGSALSGATRAAQVANPLLRAAATGAAYGAPSTVLHQAESLASGEGIAPGAAAAEMGLSMAIPVAGAAAGQALKKVAPGILRSAVKPVLEQMDTPNPPNFEAALERNLVPYFGGTEGASKRGAEALKSLGNARDAAAKAASTGPNGTVSRRVPFVGGALKDTREELTAMAKNPKTKMLSGDELEAQEALDYWLKEFRKRSTANKPGFMSVEDALWFRDKIDKSVNWRRKNQNLTPGFEATSKLLRSKIEDWIGKPHVAPEVRAMTKELGEVVPVAKALKRRALQEGNNQKLGLTDWIVLAGPAGAGAMAGGAGGAGAGAALTAAALAGKKLITTPGGSAMMYDAGRSLGRPSTLRDLLLQMGRSGLSDALAPPPEPFYPGMR